MGEFKITFTLNEPFGPLEKMAEKATTEGREYEYSNESIIEMALSEYDVSIYCQGEKIFNATVNFNEFLYELLRFAFYAITGEVSKNVRSYGWSFKIPKELPNWLDNEVRILRGLLKNKFNKLASDLFLRSFLGSYDPTLVIYGFREDEYIYLVSVDYRKVCRVPVKEFVKVAINVTDKAIQELESCTRIFEENGIKGYLKIINDYKELLKNLKELSEE